MHRGDGEWTSVPESASHPLSPTPQARQSEDDPTKTVEVGERILELMLEVGFNASVRWMGNFNCFELYVQMADKVSRLVGRPVGQVCVCVTSEAFTCQEELSG